MRSFSRQPLGLGGSESSNTDLGQDFDFGRHAERKAGYPEHDPTGQSIDPEPARPALMTSASGLETVERRLDRASWLMEIGTGDNCTPLLTRHERIWLYGPDQFGDVIDGGESAVKRCY